MHLRFLKKSCPHKGTRPTQKKRIVSACRSCLAAGKAPGGGRLPSRLEVKVVLDQVGIEEHREVGDRRDALEEEAAAREEEGVDQYIRTQRRLRLAMPRHVVPAERPRLQRRVARAGGAQRVVAPRDPGSLLADERSNQEACSVQKRSIERRIEQRQQVFRWPV